MSENRSLIVKGTARPVGSSALELPVTALIVGNVPDGQMLSCIGPEHPDYEDCLFAAESPATEEWTDYTVSPFPLWAWFAKRVTLADQTTGDPLAAVRIVLISPDLATLSFASGGVLQCLDLLRSTRGDGPYDPPVGVIFSESKTRNKRTILRMAPYREKRS